MVKISQSVKKEMEKMGLLKIEEGKHKDLVILNKKHPSRAKTYYISDDTYKIYQRRIQNQSNNKV